MGFVEEILRIRVQGGDALKPVSDDAAVLSTNLDSARRSSINLEQSLYKLSKMLLTAGAAYMGLNQHVANLKNQLVDTETRTGVSAQTLAGLKLAAEGSGLQFNEMGSILSRFVMQMNQVDQGLATATRGFDDLGVKVRDDKGNLRNNEVILRETINALNNIEDPALRAAKATGVFGARGTKLLQAFSGSSLDDFVERAKEFGVDVGPGAAKAAGDWERAMADLKLVLEGFADTVTGSFGVAVLQDFTEGIVFAAAALEAHLGNMMAFPDLFKQVFMAAIGAIGDGIAELARGLTEFLLNMQQGNILAANAALQAAPINAFKAATSGQRFEAVDTGLGGTGLAGMVNPLIAGEEARISFRGGRVKGSAGGDGGGGGGGAGGTAAERQALPSLEAERQAQRRLEDALYRANLLGASVDNVLMAFEGLPTGAGQFTEAIDNMTAEVEGKIAALQGMDTEQPSGPTGQIGMKLEGVTSAILGGTGGILSMLSSTGPIGAIIGGILSVLQDGRGGFDRLIQGLQDGAMNIMAAIPEILSSVFPTLISTFGKQVTEGAVDSALAIAEAIPDALLDIVDALPDLNEAIVKGSVALIKGLIIASPQIFGALLIELPIAIAQALWEVMTPERSGQERRADRRAARANGTGFWNQFGNSFQQEGARIGSRWSMWDSGRERSRGGAFQSLRDRDRSGGGTRGFTQNIVVNGAIASNLEEFTRHIRQSLGDLGHGFSLNPAS